MTNKQKFKDCMSNLATGVNVAVTENNQKLSGVTINTFASLSLDPMMVLFNLKKDCFCYQDFVNSKNFAINILAETQEKISQLFTKEITQQEWLALDILNKNLPCFKDSISYIECETANIHDGGDHSIITGKVINLEAMNKTAKPLLYFQRKYHKLEK